MADKSDGEGPDAGGTGTGAGNYPPPMLPMGYPGVMLAPMAASASPAAQQTKKYLSDLPPEVKSELNFLVQTVKKQRIPVGVIASCHRLLLVLLEDLERRFKPTRPRFLGVIPVAYEHAGPYARLEALLDEGAVTKAVLDEAALLKLTPRSRVTSYAGIMGDAQEAARYVAFLRFLVDVAYEAHAQCRAAALPQTKTHASTSMTVTVGPSSSS